MLYSLRIITPSVCSSYPHVSVHCPSFDLSSSIYSPITLPLLNYLSPSIFIHLSPSIHPSLSIYSSISLHLFIHLSPSVEPSLSIYIHPSLSTIHPSLSISLYVHPSTSALSTPTPFSPVADQRSSQVPLSLRCSLQLRGAHSSGPVRCRRSWSALPLPES